jgi:hypothetical protein
METLKTEKRAGEKVPYERPTLQKRERLDEVTEKLLSLSGVRGTG